MPKSSILITLAALASTARLSLACSCLAQAPVCAAYWKTPVLFIGKVVGIEYNEYEDKQIKMMRGEDLVHFAVSKSYRGEVDRKAIVHTDSQSSACGFNFQEDRAYLVYAYQTEEGRLVTSICTRTHEVLNPLEDPDLRWLDALPTAPPGASIFGRVKSFRRNESGRYDTLSLPEIAIDIKGPTSVKVSSGADGNYRADNLSPGTYDVSAALPKENEASPSRSVTLQDHACAEIDWMARINGHIRGHAYFTDGAPAAGVYLTLQAVKSGLEKSADWQAGMAIAAADGSFDFSGLEKGSYVFAVNMDFAPMDGKPYYRRVFFPGSIDRSQATVLTLRTAETVDQLRFTLPPDSHPPSIPLAVTVLDFDEKPVPHAQIVAFDDMWSAMAVLSESTDDLGKATLLLRPGSHYEIVTTALLSDQTAACVDPVEVDAKEPPLTKVLVLNQHSNDCAQHRKALQPAANPVN